MRLKLATEEACGGKNGLKTVRNGEKRPGNSPTGKTEGENYEKLEIREQMGSWLASSRPAAVENELGAALVATGAGGRSKMGPKWPENEKSAGKQDIRGLFPVFVLGKFMADQIHPRDSLLGGAKAIKEAAEVATRPLA
ncbi:MAG: hypothetical protein AB7V14_12330 [Kiritimatiellia bacterium]